MRRHLLSPILISFILLVSGCAQPGAQPAQAGENKVASVEVLDKSFVKDASGQPIAVKIIATVGLQGKGGSEQAYSCRPTYSGQFVEKGVEGKEKLEENGLKSTPVTIISTLNNRLDIGKWNVCCDFGLGLNEKKSTTVCGKQ